VLDGYKLAFYTMTHNEVKLYREYNYDVVLNFVAVGDYYDPNDLLDELEEQTKKSRIINSRFGNPYRCWFGNPTIIKYNKNYSRLTILCLGYAKRIFRK